MELAKTVYGVVFDGTLFIHETVAEMLDAEVAGTGSEIGIYTLTGRAILNAEPTLTHIKTTKNGKKVGRPRGSKKTDERSDKEMACEAGYDKAPEPQIDREEPLALMGRNNGGTNIFENSPLGPAFVA